MTKITKEKAKDAGLAAVLICLLLANYTSSRALLIAAILLVGLCIVWPDGFRPFAFVWFGLSHLLGKINTRVLLTLLFFLMVTPVGCVRRALGWDPMQLKKWKTGSSSIFLKRSHKFIPSDLERPY